MTKNYTHYVVATAIICKDSRYLIVKRSNKEGSMPGLWAFPGGKLNINDYQNKPKNTYFHWHNVLDYLVMRECKEEVGLEIKNIKYIKNLAFIRYDNIPTIVLSFSAEYAGGDIKLNTEIEDYAWVTVKEARGYDLIDGLYEELLLAHKLRTN
jgi:8-oxo-dGTP pyrophosphatase MutT (NUDIX family)